jgi:hypothetical protein
MGDPIKPSVSGLESNTRLLAPEPCVLPMRHSTSVEVDPLEMFQLKLFTFAIRL